MRPKKRPAAAKPEDGVDRSFLDSRWKPVLLQEPAPKIAKEARPGMLCRISDRILAETLAISTSFLAATFSAPLAFSKSPSARLLLAAAEAPSDFPARLDRRMQLCGWLKRQLVCWWLLCWFGLLAPRFTCLTVLALDVSVQFSG